MRISIIIPILNESTILVRNLKNLQSARIQGHEIIVVDGGSEDKNEQLVIPLIDFFESSPRGRALQMNKCAEIANGDVLVFLHIDTFLPDDGLRAITRALEDQENGWGRFDIRLSGQCFLFRVIERMMNWRSRLSGIATGDQAIFISRDLFKKVQGFPIIPIMEDVEICRRLKKIQSPICLSQKVITSSRRWESGGIFKTVWMMWSLRLAYWFGEDPSRLVKRYK